MKILIADVVTVAITTRDNMTRQADGAYISSSFDRETHLRVIRRWATELYSELVNTNPATT